MRGNHGVVSGGNRQSEIHLSVFPLSRSAQPQGYATDATRHDMSRDSRLAIRRWGTRRDATHPLRGVALSRPLRCLVGALPKALFKGTPSSLRFLVSALLIAPVTNKVEVGENGFPSMASWNDVIPSRQFGKSSKFTPPTTSVRLPGQVHRIPAYAAITFLQFKSTLLSSVFLVGLLTHLTPNIFSPDNRPRRPMTVKLNMGPSGGCALRGAWSPDISPCGKNSDLRKLPGGTFPLWGLSLLWGISL